MAGTPIDQKDGFIWIDGNLIPWKEASIHFLTHALHYGSSVFEGEKAYNGKIFKMEEHHKRLLRSAELLDMPVKYTVADINKAAMEVVSKNNLVDAYVRPLIWRGSEAMGLYSRDCTVHLGIAAWAWPPYFGKEALEKGISLCWADWIRPDPRTEPTEAKASGLYMISTLSKNKAHDRGFEDALMKDYRGYLAECTGANIFLVINGELHTPDPDCFLNGITRQTVIELAKQKGYKVHVRHIMPEEVLNADEIFVTGTAAEITPIGRIEEKTYKVGPITKDLMQAYMKLVRGE